MPALMLSPVLSVKLLWKSDACMPPGAATGRSDGAVEYRWRVTEVKKTATAVSCRGSILEIDV